MSRTPAPPLGAGRGPEPAAQVPWWNTRQFRGVLAQVLVVAGVGLLGWFLLSNTLANLATRDIATGFGFLSREAGFGISESAISYSPTSTYARALLVGLFNTLLVAFFGIVLATLLGIVAGIARLSRNILLASIASAYVEFARNVPVLLQLFFWYALITEGLPSPRQAVSFADDSVFLSNRGLFLPVPVADPAHAAMAVAAVAGIIGSVAVARWARRRRETTGQPFPVSAAVAGLIIGLPLLAWLVSGAPATLDRPALVGFNFQGGTRVTPEFTALLVGLVVYTASFIAEIVRGGILSVARGQTEAALALGLSRAQVLRLVLLPQALRVMVPPVTSQYLNLVKNSSLAVAIGYPDLVGVANTAINQTGQAVEGVAIIMAVYLTISLSISMFMNWYDRRIQLKGGR